MFSEISTEQLTSSLFLIVPNKPIYNMQKLSNYVFVNIAQLKKEARQDLCDSASLENVAQSWRETFGNRCMLLVTEKESIWMKDVTKIKR